MTSTSDLGRLLQRYVSTASETGALAEAVSVEVERVSGFHHRAVTPSGHSVLLDEPVAIGGNGKAADPAEHLLAAVGASLSVTLTAHAALRGITLSHVQVSLAATMDGQAFFQPGQGEPGLTSASIILTVRSDAGIEALRALTDVAIAVAPVLCALKIEPNIEVRLNGTP